MKFSQFWPSIRSPSHLTSSMGTTSPALPQLHGSHGSDSDSRTTCGFKPAYKENPKSIKKPSHIQTSQTSRTSETSSNHKQHKQGCWDLSGMFAAFLCNMQNWTYQYSYCITTVCRSISEYQGSCEIPSSTYIIFAEIPRYHINMVRSEPPAITKLKLHAAGFKSQNPPQLRSRPGRNCLLAQKLFNKSNIIQ